MSRVSMKKPAQCTDEPLSNSIICQKLSLLRDILSTSYGPTGRLKQIHNNVGGNILTTSTSSALFSRLDMSEPFLKLISTAIQHHITCYSDCGLFLGIFTLRLIENTQKFGLRTVAAAKVYKHLVEECNQFLKGESCGCKVAVDFSRCDSLVTLVRSMITSKPACMLNATEIQHISSLVAQAFLRSIPCNSSGPTCFGRTVTIGIDGESVSKSSVFPGLLLDVPEMLQPKDLQHLKPCPLKVVLFSMSLSGDISEVGEVSLQIRRGVDPELHQLQQLLKLGEQAVKDKVGVFACQKVIHPILQHFLREHGVVVIERLGFALMEPFVKITGARAVASLFSPVPLEAYGWVEALCFQSCGSRELLQLIPCKDAAFGTLEDTPECCEKFADIFITRSVNTRALFNALFYAPCVSIGCSDVVNQFEPLTCQRAEHVLRLTLREPYALFGRGCTETQLAAHITHKSQVTPALLGISQAEFLMAVESFRSSLLAVALSLEHDGQDCLIDLTYGHCWISEIPSQINTVPTCGCGLVVDKLTLKKSHLNTSHHLFSPALPENTKSQPRVLDSFSAKLNALNTAVELANFVIDVRYLIKDMN
ncbi:hypothetical protein DNTS_032876 [Danionella cerebrum]|uniref:McKusick-Kaufman/Bardet-Biedl syndromes chaperonin n=1 Tax=Danionella cerebrum TaxID=2873325 RepID=A0A553QUB7_9TELE|nr:hypothetical protein DNTS_032876 [Danionella translucida]